MSDYYYSYNKYLHNRFGKRVHKIGLEAGFGCPNIDGQLSSKGCIFCNNKSFSRYSNSRDISLDEQIVQTMEYAGKRFKAKKFIAYFQGFSSTYGDIEDLKKQYDVIKKYNDIVGISISTRPDCIDSEKLALIESFTSDYEVYIEYGLQTVNDKTLVNINRNHTFYDFQKAVELTMGRNISIGVHVILGLPGETKSDILRTAKIISDMPLWGIKFHCLHVVKDTVMQERYEQKMVNILSANEYIDLAVSFMEYIPKEWVVLRLFSEEAKGLVISPIWACNKYILLKMVEGEFKRRKTCQGVLYESACIKNQ